MLLLELTVSFKELVWLLFPWNQFTGNQNIFVIVILIMKEQHVIETLHSKKQQILLGFRRSGPRLSGPSVPAQFFFA